MLNLSTLPTIAKHTNHNPRTLGSPLPDARLPLVRMVAFAAMLLGVALPVAAQDGDKVVHVYNWSDYIDDSILAAFTEETGIQVVYDVFDSNNMLETKLLAGNSGYDVVVPSDAFLQRQISAGVFQKLDNKQLPNRTHLWEVITEASQSFDPDNAYSINYMWGTNGIGYNIDKVAARLPDVDMSANNLSWDIVFNPDKLAELADCGVHILDAADEIIPLVLNYLGEDPKTTDPAVLALAEPVLQDIRPYVQKFHSSAYINALANGDICLAVGWSGDILQARDRAEEAGNGVVIDYAVPVEGTLIWFDQMAIPNDAPNPEHAHAFINYMMRPEVIAKASNYVYYANGNLASQAFLLEDVLGDPAIYPDDAAMANFFTSTAYPPKPQRALTRLWTNMKRGQ